MELSRGKQIEHLAIEELAPAEAAPVLQRYVREVGDVVRPFFDAGPEDHVGRFEAEAAQHPVFRLVARP